MKKILFALVILSSFAYSEENSWAESTSESCCQENCCDTPCFLTNVYFGIEGGLNWASCESVGGCKDDTDMGYSLGGLLGYLFPIGIGMEFEVAYRTNSVDHINYRYYGMKIDTDKNISCISYLGNLYYELPCWCVKPYAGFGLGYSNEHARLTQYNLPTDKNFNNFTYQFIAGLDYNLCGNLDIGVGYKYLHVVSSFIDNNSLLFDLKWHF